MTTIRLAPQSIEAKFAAAEANADSRTVPVKWYTGATVKQFSWEKGLHNLTLTMDPSHVDMGRLQSGAAPFTRGHASPNDPGAVIGKVVQASLDAQAGTANVRFSKRPDVEPIFQDVVDGILANVSLEATIHAMKETTEEGDPIRSFIATKWEPTAIALVAQGADPGARINAAAEVEHEVEVEFAFGASAPKEENMEQLSNGTSQAAATVTLSEAEQATIRNRVQAAKLPAAFGEDLIARHLGPNEATNAIFTRLAEQSEVNACRSHAAFVRDEREGLVEAMSEGLAARFTGQEPSERARQFAGARLADLARHICQVNDLRPRSMSPAEYIRLAYSTSDFPQLLQGTGNRILLKSYEQFESPIKQIARGTTADDFRAKTLLRLGEMPDLLKVPESGEIKHGTRTEKKESYQLYTFGRQFGLTRQAQINDDLGAFKDYFAEFGAAAARLEGAQLIALLAANAGLGASMDDALPLFDAAHSNYISSGTAISVDNLGIARTTMRLQTGIDGTTILGIAPKFLVVNSEKETIAEQYLSALAAAEAANSNPFAGKLKLLCIPELSNISATAWYMWADPQAFPILEWAHLASQPGPQIDTRQGWDVLGAEFRCYIDFGCGIVGTRGAVLNAGA